MEVFQNVYLPRITKFNLRLVLSDNGFVITAKKGAASLRITEEKQENVTAAKPNATNEQNKTVEQDLVPASIMDWW